MLTIATVLALASLPSVASAASGSTRNIGASGAKLTLGGRLYTFVGVDAYELATDWGNNAGCGGMLSDAQMASFFASLPAGAVVRFQAFQETTGINPTTHQLTWAGLDRVFAAASTAAVKVIPVLAGQGAGCDGGHWQDPAWYNGGYNQVFNNSANSDGRGLQPLSYAAWVTSVVNRYRSSPALGMWEPIGEAEASSCAAAYQPTSCSGHQTCPSEATATAALANFYTSIGGLIHTLDPAHLVEAGLLGGGQCGTQGPDYQGVISTRGVDVASYHDYYGVAPLGGDQWNGVEVRIAQAHAANKPIIAGEVGIAAGVGSLSCASTARRVSEMAAKLAAQFSAGSSGELIWNWSLDTLGPCSFNTTMGDPLMTWLATAI
jgi:hypothetical protein